MTRDLLYGIAYILLGGCVFLIGQALWPRGKRTQDGGRTYQRQKPKNERD